MKMVFYLYLVGVFIWNFPTFLSGDEIHRAVYNQDLQRTKDILIQDPKKIHAVEDESLIIRSDKMAQYQEILRFNFTFNTKRAYSYPNLKGYTPLMLAVVEDSPKLVDLLLSFGARVNDTSPEGLNSIHLASIIGDGNILRQLLHQEKADIRSRDKHGFTPLLLAAALGNSDILSTLIQMGMKVNDSDNNGVTPLMYAALSGQIAMVENLVKAGVKVEAKDDLGNTPLMYAAFGADTGIIAYLVHLGAKIDVQNNRGLTPLLYAAISGELRTLQFLLHQGADPRQVLGRDVVIDRLGKQYPKGSGILRISQINHDYAMINYLSSDF